MNPADKPEIPPLPKPIRSSKYWDEGIEWALAGERAARLEREDQLRAAQQRIATLEAEKVELLQRKNRYYFDYCEADEKAGTLEEENASLRTQLEGVRNETLTALESAYKVLTTYSTSMEFEAGVQAICDAIRALKSAPPQPQEEK